MIFLYINICGLYLQIKNNAGRFRLNRSMDVFPRCALSPARLVGGHCAVLIFTRGEPASGLQYGKMQICHTK
jgi:hypothetical protein